MQVYSLDTYDRRSVIHAHKGSVLGLCLSHDRKWLFSSAADPIVNVRASGALDMVCAKSAGLVHVDVQTPIRSLVTIR